ncbi:MAG: hypothetical protein AUH28_10955 [Acidobacteria bacterium 13_1_40CM_56_16]|nr:MAG: hypothetical protein AUH28_10955 [Acidobacteria bacterium 13_1_40CM_56_16]OLD71669.1 MAG: hypothetical protein AUI45_01020 [Acidobacteria bacterium 13_1_40CM_2_56_11]
MKLVLLAAFILFLAVPIFADSSALIVRGVAGSPEHETKFDKWTEGTQKALVEKFGFSSDRVIVLSDKKSAQAEIQKAFATLKQQLKPADTFFLFFIGHGSGDDGVYKFNISGPDYTADDYNKLLSTLPVGRIVIVLGTPASGAAIEKFAGKNRVIITATRSGQEGNDIVFYDYFLEALESPAADEDKDQKISVWEAFKYAVAGTERFYKEEGRLATEHPQISDNGTEKTGVTTKEVPLVARATSFQVDRPIVSSDPKLQALLNQRKEIEQKIEDLRINKNTIPEVEYDKQMESLLVQLALKNQEIRQQEAKK